MASEQLMLKMCIAA